MKCDWDNCKDEGIYDAKITLTDKKTGEKKDEKTIHLCERHLAELMEGVAPQIESLKFTFEDEKEATKNDKLWNQL